MFTVEVQSALTEAAKNRYWRRCDAEMVLSFWRKSGQGLSAFARAWGMNVARLRRWRSRLDGEALPTFHPVSVVDAPALEAAGPTVEVSAEAGSVDVVVGSRRVVVRPGFDEATFVRLVRLLESTC